MKKFNKLYELIMEEYSFDKARNDRYWNLLKQIKSAPSQQVLTNIYENNKEFIDNNENLILALLKNANSTHVFKNQFRNSEFQYIQDWFNVQDGEYPSNYMSDEDWDTYNDFTNGEDWR
jgi:hypothetical protein